ncbi:PorP/SprF family type IX secretion system membrane protein [Flavobacterium silvaticum]|uniref:Type IX secretion system membrane protein PorP/SprF n=1 Tax=Flavobacterium silvaticum TaxID=1852020 RepID=A0A972FUM7_9FLAO|nr:type IX secretion system membrane protein PorP/SprF [Flavobacterium silvaticum]NMH28838.1 type IX secretion system membrane protein PorP/SprF [Flavobacterium silvaticum]
MKNKIILFAMLLTGIASFAQQDAQYTEYMYNTVNINPAYAGSRGAMSFFGLYRTQWVGLDGAPKTGAFSLNTPIGNSRLGLGLGFINDQIGPTDQSTFNVDISYTVPMGETTKLSFGIKGSADFFSLDVNKLDPSNASDPNLQSYNSKLSPNIGAGAYLHGDNYYVGLSVPRLLQQFQYDDNNVEVSKAKMHYYLIGGYVFDVSPSTKLKPALLLKAVQGAPLQADISLNAMFIDKFTLGAAYRWDAAWSAMAGIQITDGLMLGYAYDMETTRLKNYSSGSHEIYLRFELVRKYKDLVTPRFF